MKNAICLNNEDNMLNLTVGKIYEFKYHPNPNYIVIKDDFKVNITCNAVNFKVITPLMKLSMEAKERGFLPGAKFMDLTRNVEFTVRAPLYFDLYGKTTQLYVAVEDGVNNLKNQKTARIYKDGVWTNVINVCENVVSNNFKILRDFNNSDIINKWCLERNNKDNFYRNCGYVFITNGIPSTVKFSDDTKYTEITFEEFEKYILKNKKDNTNMESEFLISRAQFKKLYDVACSSWKERLSGLIKKTINEFEDSGLLNSGQVREMYKAISNDNQREVFFNVFPTFRINETLNELRGKGDYFATGEVRLEHAPLLGIRNQGEYKSCAFALDKRFNWELKTDSLGVKVLIPSRK